MNENGGILGRPVELVVENDESDPTKAPTVIRKLLDAGANALVLQSAGAAVMQAKPVVQEAGIIAIAPTSISQTVAQPPDADFTYVLANPLSDFVTVYCAGFEAAGIESLAVLSDNTPTIESVNGLLLPGLKECVDVVAEETAPVDTSDVNAQVARVKDSGPGRRAREQRRRQLRGAGPEHAVRADARHDAVLARLDRQPAELVGAGEPEALEGLIFMASIDPTNPRTQELQEFLEPLHDDDWAMTAYDTQAYDTVQLIKMAIENAGSTDPAAVSTAMNAITEYQPHFGQESSRCRSRRRSTSAPTACAGCRSCSSVRRTRPKARGSTTRRASEPVRVGGRGAHA